MKSLCLVKNDDFIYDCINNCFGGNSQYKNNVKKRIGHLRIQVTQFNTLEFKIEYSIDVLYS